MLFFTGLFYYRTKEREGEINSSDDELAIGGDFNEHRTISGTVELAEMDALPGAEKRFSVFNCKRGRVSDEARLYMCI